MFDLCAEVFDTPLQKISAFSEACEGHALLITGQKYDQRTKSCSYELVNSWGASDGKYHLSYERGAAHNTIWIPAYQAEKAMLELKVFSQN